MDQYYFEIRNVFLLRLAVEAGLAASFLFFCLRRRRSGGWAIAGAAAAACWMTVFALELAAALSTRLGGPYGAYIWTGNHFESLEWVRVVSVGVLLLSLRSVVTRSRSAA